MPFSLTAGESYHASISDGLSDFFTLHAALAGKSAPRATLVAFDLMHLDGEDMRGRALEDRRAVLADVINKRAPWLQFSESLEGDGSQVWCRPAAWAWKASSRNDAARLTSPVRAPYWRKTRCTLTDHFAVMGADRQGRSLRLARLLDRGARSLRFGGLGTERQCTLGKSAPRSMASRQSSSPLSTRLHPVRRAASPGEP